MTQLLTQNQIDFIKYAAFNGNPFDLYDSIADAGLETSDFYDNSHDIEYMRAFAFNILFSAVDGDGNCAI